MPEYDVITVVHFHKVVEAANEAEAEAIGWKYGNMNLLHVYDIEVEEIVEDEEE